MGGTPNGETPNGETPNGETPNGETTKGGFGREAPLVTTERTARFSI